MSLRTVAGLALMLPLAGCTAGWKPVTFDAQTNFKPRDDLQVWIHGKAQRWHGVRVDSATVSGVPHTKPPDCDSCRITVPRTAVDSIRAGDPDGAFVANVVGVVVIGGLGYFMFFKPG